MDGSFKTSEGFERAERKFVFDQPLKIDVHALRCVFSLTFVFGNVPVAHHPTSCV